MFTLYYQWAEDKQARGESIINTVVIPRKPVPVTVEDGLGSLGGVGAQLTACDPPKASSFTP